MRDLSKRIHQVGDTAIYICDTLKVTPGDIMFSKHSKSCLFQEILVSEGAAYN